MEYKTVIQISEEWNITPRAVRNYCNAGKINGAQKIGKIWLIPSGAVAPKRMSKKDLLSVLKNELEDQTKNGIYHGLQVDSAYNTTSLDGCNVTREQVRYMFDTKTLPKASEAILIDDLIEINNHFKCVNYIIKTAKKPLKEAYIRKLFCSLENATEIWENNLTTHMPYRKKDIVFNEVHGAEPEEIEEKLKNLFDEYEEKICIAAKNKEKIGLDELLELLHGFMMIAPFDKANGKIGRLILLKECLRNEIVPFLIESDMKIFYDRGVVKWKEEPSILRNAVLVAQDKFRTYLDYFKIKYKKQK